MKRGVFLRFLFFFTRNLTQQVTQHNGYDTLSIGGLVVSRDSLMVVYMYVYTKYVHQKCERNSSRNESLEPK